MNIQNNIGFRGAIYKDGQLLSNTSPEKDLEKLQNFKKDFLQGNLHQSGNAFVTLDSDNLVKAVKKEGDSLLFDMVATKNDKSFNLTYSISPRDLEPANPSLAYKLNEAFHFVTSKFEASTFQANSIADMENFIRETLISTSTPSQEPQQPITTPLAETSDLDEITSFENKLPQIPDLEAFPPTVLQELKAVKSPLEEDGSPFYQILKAFSQEILNGNLKYDDATFNHSKEAPGYTKIICSNPTGMIKSIQKNGGKLVFELTNPISKATRTYQVSHKDLPDDSSEQSAKLRDAFNFVYERFEVPQLLPIGKKGLGSNISTTNTGKLIMDGAIQGLTTLLAASLLLIGGSEFSDQENSPTEKFFKGIGPMVTAVAGSLPAITTITANNKNQIKTTKKAEKIAFSD